MIVRAVAESFSHRCDLVEHVQKHQVIKTRVVWFALGRLSEQLE